MLCSSVCGRIHVFIEFNGGKKKEAGTRQTMRLSRQRKKRRNSPCFHRDFRFPTALSRHEWVAAPQIFAASARVILSSDRSRKYPGTSPESSGCLRTGCLFLCGEAFRPSCPPGFPFLSGSEEKRTPHKTCRKGRETPAVHLRSIFDSARVFRQQQCHALFFPAYRTCHMWLKRKLPYCGNPTFSMPKAINEKTPCDFSQGVDFFLASPGGFEPPLTA